MKSTSSMADCRGETTYPSCRGILAAVAFLVLLAGCGQPADAPVDPMTSNVRKVAETVERFRIAHHGALPKSLDEFKSYVREQGEAIKTQFAIADPESILVSERDGQPLEFRFGKELDRNMSGGPTVVCHEAQGVDGARFVGYLGGAVDLMDEAAFRQAVGTK